MHYKIILIITLLLTGCRVDPDEKAWAALLQGIRTAYPDVQQLSTTELHTWLNDSHRQPPLLLDTREPEEFKVSHLQKAKLLSEFDLTSSPKDQPIVTYCSVGARSSAAARKLQQQGYTVVYNLEGSIFQWFNENRPVVRDGQPVNEVHPYDENWGKFVNHERHEKARKN